MVFLLAVGVVSILTLINIRLKRRNELVAIPYCAKKSQRRGLPIGCTTKEHYL